MRLTEYKLYTAYNGSSTCAVLWEVNPGRTHSKTRSNPVFIGKPLAAAVTPCCGHRPVDPLKDVADFQAVTATPSVGEKESPCTLGGSKRFRVGWHLEGHRLPREYERVKPHVVLGWTGLSWAEKDPSCF